MLARGKYADYPDIANTMDALRKWHAHLVERKEERRGGGGEGKKKNNNKNNDDNNNMMMMSCV